MFDLLLCTINRDIKDYLYHLYCHKSWGSVLQKLNQTKLTNNGSPRNFLHQLDCIVLHFFYFFFPTEEIESTGGGGEG